MCGLDSALSALRAQAHSSDLEDVEFRVGAEGEAIMAHRLILSMRSPVFHAQLNGRMREALHPEEPIRVTDVTPAAFMVRMRSLY